MPFPENLNRLVPWTSQHTHYGTCIHCTNSLPEHWRVRLAVVTWKGIELRAALAELTLRRDHGKTSKG